MPLPPSADLRPDFERLGLPPRRQGPRGTCSVFTVTGALEWAIARRRRRGERLSVEFLNWAGHQAVGRRVDGGFFSDMWKGFEKSGVCSEAVWPYRESFDPDDAPPADALKDARRNGRLRLELHWIKEWNPNTGVSDEQLAAIRERIARGTPVCGGLRWPRNAHWDHNTLRMCPPEEVFDGHSILLVGYRDDPGVFVIRNSGVDHDNGELPYAYVREYLNDACWIR